ncbi:MAG: T9SS type A sorting domain-containing protein, partial [Bacteroidales bacterium]|nr:T9SS type A sorting domain-containing protein [Bacteroidales bacterium]
NGNPLEGASIEIAGETLTTDANGEATLLLVNGSYPYEVTATNHTTATGEAVVNGADLEITITLTSTVGITELQGFRIYPNPATSYVRIEGASIQKAELLQLTGVVVRTFENPTGSLSLQGIRPGYYFLRLYSNGKVIVYRLMVR